MASKEPMAAQPPRVVDRPEDHSDSDGDGEHSRFDDDLTILDYVLYKATMANLVEADRRAHCHSIAVAPLAGQPRAELRRHTTLVETFLTTFKRRHEGLDVPASTLFRVKLVRFVTVYASRLIVRFPDTSDPQTMVTNQSNLARTPLESQTLSRRLARGRAQRWITAVGQDSQHNQLARLHLGPDMLDAAGPDGPDQDTTLLDLLPSFVSLTATFAALRDARLVTSEKWINLAAEVMLQAAAETALLREHASGEARLADAIAEAFAWGPLDDEEDEEIDADVEGVPLVHDVFYIRPVTDDTAADSILTTDEDDATTAAPWRAARAAAIAALAPALPPAPAAPAAPPCTPALRALLTGGAHDPRACDDEVRAFLAAVTSTIGPPILAQLEAAHAAPAGHPPPPMTLEDRAIPPETAARLLALYREGLAEQGLPWNAAETRRA